jgi:prepilin-type N-terminal cleavage/methylation domain-containing protein
MGSASATHRGALPSASRSRSDGGFTLVEVLAAMVVFVIISTATVTIVIQGLRLLRENSDRGIAANIARDELDYWKSLGTAGINPGLTVGAHSAAVSDDFIVRTTAAWVGFNQSQGACAASTPGKDYMRVTVQVSSSNISDAQTLDTIITPPANAAAPSLGSARIFVRDRDDQPVSDVIVAGFPAGDLVTGAEGCIFLPNLTPATLTITVSKSGYVPKDSGGQTQSAVITAANLTEKTFSFAAASSIAFSSANPDYSLPSVMPVMWKLNATGAVAAKSTVATVITNRWPLTTGFTSWAGSCSDADPLVYSGSPQSFVFTSGATTSAALNTALVKIRGLPKDTMVTANYTGPDGACGQAPVQLGKSNDLGILKVGLPYGKWSFIGGGQTQPLATPLAPPVAGSPATPVVVNFTLADLDNPSPSPTPTGTGTASPTATPTATPTPTVTP